MTEAEWLACSEPEQALGFLWSKTSARKMRLLAVACCRRVSEWLPHQTSIPAVKMVECFADEIVTKQDMDKAVYADTMFAFVNDEDDIGLLATNAIIFAAQGDGIQAAQWTAEIENLVTGIRQDEATLQQAKLVRCIFGNPFRSVQIDPVWLAWAGGTVVKLAQGIYDERAFDRMPILGDALEDAGCIDGQILEHCRGPGPHVRGCWLVDLLLNKT